jgi:hypothetical protein
MNRPHARRRSGRAIIALVFLVASAAVLTDVLTYAKNYNNPPIRSDGFAYYLYLPAVLLYHDAHFRFVTAGNAALNMYPTKNIVWTGLKPGKTGYIDKYPCGAAIMQLPFFLSALSVADFLYRQPGGFEPPFQYANAVSAAFFLCLGAVLLYLTCARGGDDWLSLGLVSFAILGTNALHYGSYDGSLSHVYCFCLCSACAYLAFVQRTKLPDTAYYAMLGAVIGLGIIVRPTNALWLPLAFIAPPVKLPAIARSATAFAVGLFALLTPQLLFWFVATGHFVIYSYRNEGFDFLSPHVIDYLFSVRKGEFFWQPAYLLLAIGTLFAALKGRYEACILVGIVCVATYVNSSWRPWSFGGSFGARPAVDTLPLLVVGTSLALKEVAMSRKIIAAAVAPMTVLVAVNFIEMHGYITHAIPYDGTTWAMYSRFWRNIL